MTLFKDDHGRAGIQWTIRKTTIRLGIVRLPSPWLALYPCGHGAQLAVGRLVLGWHTRHHDTYLEA